MATSYYLNLNYVCNEHCVFCASDLTNGLERLGDSRISKQLTLAEIRDWMADDPPRDGDQVLLAGGEPTLHRDLCAIVAEFATRCADIKLFTNGVRLANCDYASAVLASGVSGFEVALFGATAASHDAITKRAASFDQTFAALDNLLRLRGPGVRIVVRLLVAEQCYAELPDIVDAAHARSPGIDEFSINRLIYSQKATESGVPVSWAEAAPAINEAVRRARVYGYGVNFWPVPLCVFRGPNRRFVRSELARLAEQQDRQQDRGPSSFRYLDPVVAAGVLVGSTQSGAAVATPDVCRRCALQAICGGVEQPYVERFGTAGLRRVAS